MIESAVNECAVLESAAMNAPMKAASLIVAGTPFSGAALLGHVLGAHSEAFFAGELGREWDRGAEPGELECRTCRGGCEMWRDPSVAAAVANGPGAVSAALAATTGRRVVIEGPVPAGWLAVRLACGEPSGDDARIVICVCDPMLYVRKRAGVTEEFAKQRAIEWRDEQNALVSAALSSGRPVLVVRYEDLVNQPGGTLARVCAFAGIEYEPALARWWEAPSHAIGANSEAWGVAGFVRANRARTAPADPRERRVATMPALDRDPGASFDVDVAHAVITELRPTGLYEMFGYEPALPPYRAPRDDAERQGTAAWVKSDLRRIREDVLHGRANAAISTLKLLVDHFGPAFDDLGLEAKYGNLALVLVELLSNQQRAAEALPYACALAVHAPHDPEAQRSLALASASVGDVPVTLESLRELEESLRKGLDGHRVGPPARGPGEGARRPGRGLAAVRPPDAPQPPARVRAQAPAPEKAAARAARKKAGTKDQVAPSPTGRGGSIRQPMGKAGAAAGDGTR